MFDISHEHFLGKPTYHLPLNMIIQKVEGTKITGVLQTVYGSQLLFSENTHHLIIGDVFIRPQLVFGSRHLVGRGIASIARDGFNADEWVQNGTMLFKRE